MKKKIFITSEGFIGTELYRLFNLELEKYDVKINLNKELDLLNSKKVEEFFDNNEFNLCIHTAKKAGRRFSEENPKDFYDNIIMFENIIRCHYSYKNFIQFGSGNEFSWMENVNCVREQDVFKGVPTSYYDFSKWLISKRICDLGSKFTNLRLFGCFSENENHDRFIKANLLKYINKKEMVIFQNREFDFFHIQDVYRIIKHFIDNDGFPRYYSAVNLTYATKCTLRQIAEFINSLGDYKVPILIENNEIGKKYSGLNFRLRQLGLATDNLFERIREVYNILKEKKN